MNGKVQKVGAQWVSLLGVGGRSLPKEELVGSQRGGPQPPHHPSPGRCHHQRESTNFQLFGPLAQLGASGGCGRGPWKPKWLNPPPPFCSQIAQRQLGCRRFNIPSKLPPLITITRDCYNIHRNVQSLQHPVLTKFPPAGKSQCVTRGQSPTCHPAFQSRCVWE